MRGILYTLYKINSKKQVVFKFNVGDTVRISKLRGVFRKGYEQTFKGEFFTVTQRLAKEPPVYRLTDLAGEAVKGTFYEQELQQVIIDKKTKPLKLRKYCQEKDQGLKAKPL